MWVWGVFWSPVKKSVTTCRVRCQGYAECFTDRTPFSLSNNLIQFQMRELKLREVKLPT